MNAARQMVIPVGIMLFVAGIAEGSWLSSNGMQCYSCFYYPNASSTTDRGSSDCLLGRGTVMDSDLVNMSPKNAEFICFTETTTGRMLNRIRRGYMRKTAYEEMHGVRVSGNECFEHPEEHYRIRHTKKTCSCPTSGCNGEPFSISGRDGAVPQFNKPTWRKRLENFWKDLKNTIRRVLNI